MSTAVAVRDFSDLDDVQRAAKMMLASGYFEAQRDPAVGVAQLAVKILAGREMGYGPFAAVQGIHVIQGKPALSANLMAAAVKASPRYDYRVRKMDAGECSIEFFQLYDGKRESLGVSTFTAADAKQAGVKNLDKFPRNMLFARAMSNGVRWFCPDVFSGNAVYVPEELGATVDGETGEILDYQPPTQPVGQATTPAQDASPVDNPFTDDNGNGMPPAVETQDAYITEKQLRMLHALGTQVYGDEGWKEKRPKLVEAVTRGEHHSAASLLKTEATKLIDGLRGRLANMQKEAPPAAELTSAEPLAF